MVVVAVAAAESGAPRGSLVAGTGAAVAEQVAVAAGRKSAGSLPLVLTPVWHVWPRGRGGQ